MWLCCFKFLFSAVGPAVGRGLNEAGRDSMEYAFPCNGDPGQHRMATQMIRLPAILVSCGRDKNVRKPNLKP